MSGLVRRATMFSARLRQRHDVPGWTREVERMQGMGAQLSDEDKGALAPRSGRALPAIVKPFRASRFREPERRRLAARATAYRRRFVPLGSAG